MLTRDARPENLQWLTDCDRLGVTVPGRRVAWRGKSAGGPAMMRMPGSIRPADWVVKTVASAGEGRR